MKNHFRFLLGGVLLSLFLVTGCSDDDDAEPTPTVTQSMTAKFNGANWIANPSKFKVYLINDILNIEAIAADSTIIIMQAEGPFVVGNTYSLEAYPEIGMFVDYSSGSVVPYLSNGGSLFASLEITALDSVSHRISGTFGFEAEDQLGNVVAIEDGIFTTLFYQTSWTEDFGALLNGAAFYPVFYGGYLGSSGIEVSGTAQNGAAINVHMPADIVPGTYAMGNSTTPIYGEHAWWSTDESTTGTLIITSNNPLREIITGTFEFDGGTYLVRSGHFSVSYD